MQLLLIANLLLISIINGIFAMNFAVPMKPKSPSGLFANFYRLTVQIERLTENPIFAYLYWEEEWKWRSPVRYKLQLYRHGMHAEKFEGEILTSQNGSEFDEFTFEGLPLAWIDTGNVKNRKRAPIPGNNSATDPQTQRQLEKTLELRVEIPAINQVLFHVFQIKAFGNSRDYSYRFKYLLKPPLIKQIPAAGSLPPPQMEMAILHLAAEQREFCAQTRQSSLLALVDLATQGVGGFLSAQFYRDAQWLEYNVLLFWLETMEKLEDMGAFENVELAKIKIRDLRKELATLMSKLWIMQDDYIVIRSQIQADKAFAIKKLIEKGPEIDTLLDEFAAKITQLAKMLQTENTAENVKGKGKAPTGISAIDEGHEVTDFASNQVHHQEGGIRLFGQNLGQPSVQHLAEAGTSRPKKRMRSTSPPTGSEGSQRSSGESLAQKYANDSE